MFAFAARFGPAAFQLNGSALVPWSFNLFLFLLGFVFSHRNLSASSSRMRSGKRGR